MSFQAMTWAVEQQCSGPGQKLVLLMLANRVNRDTGKCTPSQKLLADECCMSVSSVKTHLQALADRGLLTIIPRSKDGVSIPNQYRLRLFGGGSDSMGVGQNLTDPPSKSGGGVRQNLATNQEVKPGREPGDARKLAPTPPQGGKASRSPTSLPDWLDSLPEGERVFADDDPVRTYAAKVGIPSEFVALAWAEFRNRYSSPDAKRYKDWRQVFRNAVRANWMRLWFADDQGEYRLTTAGQQAQREQEADQ